MKMKELKISGEFKFVVIKNQDGTPATSTAYDQICMVIGRAPAGGLNLVDVTKRTKIISKIVDAYNKNEESVLLEAAEFGIVTDAVNQYPFGVCDPAQAACMQAILDSKEVEVAPKEPKPE